jgi:lysophospholipase L1-like esterase
MYPDNVTVVFDFYDQIAFQAKYLFDPIHPNDEGHEVLAQYLEPIVFTKLEEIRMSE